LEYVENDDEGGKIKYHFRGKGIPKDQLSLGIFEEMMNGLSIKIEMNRDFKRIMSIGTPNSRSVRISVF